jgi:cell division protein FtsI (penicillin-binding protein 3)
MSESKLRPGAWRRRLLLAGWLAASLGVCLRAGQIQIGQKSVWRSIAENQHKQDNEVAAARGTVLERDGAPLVVSRETYRVGVAPNELRDPDATRALLQETLGLSARKARQLVSADRVWAQVPGRFPPAVRESLRGVRGVYLQRELERHLPHGDLARGVLGTVLEGEGRGGIEQAFESLLRGRAGKEVTARDNLGKPIPGETYRVEAPQRGGQVVLTLDLDLQEIARQALLESIRTTDARGGDVLVTDPGTGEVLALVSVRDGKTAGLGAINTPYEPGSTLKPFTVAGMLTTGVASLSDTVDVEDGTWRVGGRTLHDTHGGGRMTVAHALQTSSNVGIAKAAQGLTPGDQYENLRDFGFGVPTGIELPGEVAGTLRRPDRWSGQSPASLAIGYEISVTPLQMAMAYGALANGGLLMEPRIVREIRDNRGNTLERFEPRVVRRTAPAEVVRSVSEVLVDVVEDGTGTAARIGTFSVAGKSGTSRIYDPESGYSRDHHYASFAGFFPAEDPQLVVFVKLEDPKEGYYGGTVAAPVTRATMEAALAARSTHLDRAQLLRLASQKPVVSATGESPVRFAANPLELPRPWVSPDPGVVEREARTACVGGWVPVPSVAGLPARVAARRLHALGLRVRQDRSGIIVGTVPAAGTRLVAGDTVHLRVQRRTDD